MSDIIAVELTGRSPIQVDVDPQNPVAVDVIRPPGSIEVGMVVLEGPPGPRGEQGEQGERGERGPAGDTYIQPFVFDQASVIWMVQHNLGRYPAVTLLDSAGDVFDGVYHYIDLNAIRVELPSPTSGTVYLN